MRLGSTDIIITADDRPGAFRPQSPQGARRGPEPSAQAPARAKAKRRLPRLRLELSRPVKLAATGLLLACLAGGGVLAWKSGKPQRAVQQMAAGLLETTAEAGFQVGDITVTGRRRTPTDQLISALDTRYGDPILGLDIAAARARIEALPSVRAAAIERRLPGAIHLSISEREPVALWQTEGRFVLVDRDGRSIPGAIEGYEDLPLVVGEGAPARTDELFALLNTEPELAARVKAAIRVGNRRWNVKLDDVEQGLEARLPELDAEASWHRLAQLEKARTLSAKRITVVDFRVPERLILRSGPGTPPVSTAQAAHPAPARER